MGIRWGPTPTPGQGRAPVPALTVSGMVVAVTVTAVVKKLGVVVTGSGVESGRTEGPAGQPQAGPCPAWTGMQAPVAVAGSCKMHPRPAVSRTRLPSTGHPQSAAEVAVGMGTTPRLAVVPTMAGTRTAVGAVSVMGRRPLMEATGCLKIEMGQLGQPGQGWTTLASGG